MAPPARVWPHRRGNRGRDDRGADPRDRVWPRDRLHLCPHGPQPGHRLVEHGVGETPPPMAPPARVWPHRRGNRGRDDRGADPRARVWPGERLHPCPHGPQPRHRLVEHGVGETPPPWPPRLACGRTTVGIVAVTTAALIHVIVSGLATRCIYAPIALSLVTAWLSKAWPSRPPHGPPGSRVAAPPWESWP